MHGFGLLFPDQSDCRCYALRFASSGWRNADMTPRRKIRVTLCRVVAARAVISDQLTKMHPQIGITEPAGSIRPHTNLRLSNFILRPIARTDRASKAP